MHNKPVNPFNSLSYIKSIVVNKVARLSAVAGVLGMRVNVLMPMGRGGPLPTPPVSGARDTHTPLSCTISLLTPPIPLAINMKMMAIRWRGWTHALVSWG
jgi:hypothetical protein